MSKSFALGLPTFVTVLAAGLALGALGCSVETAETATNAEAEATGETSSALCSDSAVAANATLTIGGEGSYATVTSPSSTYGTTACANTYVVDIKGTKGKPLNLWTGWGENLPATKEACPFALVAATVYGEKPGYFTMVNGVFTYHPAVWVKLGPEASAGGKWSEGSAPGDIFQFPAACSLNLDLSTAATSGYDKIRVATKAAAFAIFTIPTRKATVSVSNPTIIK